MVSRQSTREFGQQGEQLAKQYLLQKGYSIVATNWRCSFGEIDIIAQSQGVLLFIEVRTRRAKTTEVPFESITAPKRRKLAHLAYVYLSANAKEDVIWRVDVIAIAIPRNGQPIIEHIEDALGW
jgi:putative endonuclease